MNLPRPLHGLEDVWQRHVAERRPFFDKNPHYVRLGYAGHGDMWTGIQNEGFFGIGLKKDAEYRFSVWARVPDGKPVTLMVQFIDQNTMDDAQQFVSQDLVIDSKEWKKYTMVMKSNRTIAKANLRIFLSNPQHRSGTGTVDLEHVSLSRSTLDGT